MKALASDIDGTLVFNQQIKKQDKEAIEKYHKKNIFLEYVVEDLDVPCLI